MSLIGDLKEAKELWGKSSWTFRIGILLSAFVATGSIASLSELAFRWKGFILDGIAFYQDWVRGLLISLASFFSILVKPHEADIFFLVTLCFGLFVRSFIGLKDYTAAVFFTSSFFLVVYVLLSSNIFYLDILILITVVLFYIWPIFQLRKYSELVELEDPEKVKKARIDYLFFNYAPLILSTIAVFILAAINEGLIRTQ